MSLALMYYLAGVLGNMGVLLTIISAALGIILIISTLVTLLMINDVRNNTLEAWQKAQKALIPAFIISGILACTAPSKKDMVMIMGLSVGQKGAEKVLDEASEFYPLIKDLLKKELEELSGDGEEKK